MTFEPRDPDFERRTRENYGSQGFMRTLGAAMSKLEPGRCQLTLPFRDALSQQHSFFHGGAIAAFASVVVLFQHRDPERWRAAVPIRLRTMIESSLVTLFSAAFPFLGGGR